MDDFDAVVHVVPPRCGYCDGTGDVHSLDGEWRGVCTECEDGAALRASIASWVAWRAYSKAWPEAMAGMREVFIGGSSLGRREIVQPGWLNWGGA